MALHCNLVQLSTYTFSNICQREYSLTVNANLEQLAARHKVSLALDSWTSRNKFAITLVIAYNIEPNCALLEVHLTFDEVDTLFSFYFKI